MFYHESTRLLGLNNNYFPVWENDEFEYHAYGNRLSVVGLDTASGMFACTRQSAHFSPGPRLFDPCIIKIPPTIKWYILSTSPANWRNILLGALRIRSIWRSEHIVAAANQMPAPTALLQRDEELAEAQATPLPPDGTCKNQFS